MTGVRTILAICALAASSPLAALAQGAEIGAREYANSCAQCHGASGKGDGVLAGYLTQPIPDLTTLQRDNGGVFPLAQVYDLVAGPGAAGAHGTQDMPAWGDRYAAEAPAQLGEFFAPGDREAFVRGRILALVEYVSTLQQP
jgi:mono/diheme cytochrome c family protein